MDETLVFKNNTFKCGSRLTQTSLLNNKVIIFRSRNTFIMHEMHYIFRKRDNHYMYKDQ